MSIIIKQKEINRIIKGIFEPFCCKIEQKQPSIIGEKDEKEYCDDKRLKYTKKDV